MLSEAVSGLKTVAEIVNQVTNVVDVGPPEIRSNIANVGTKDDKRNSVRLS